MSLSLSLVIPTRNGAARLRETLASVAAQKLEGTLEVVVVDDGSTDDTGRLAALFSLPWGRPRVLRHETSRGRGAACNTGIRAARAERIVLLDDDMTLRPGALQAHLAFHRANPSAAARARVVLAAPEKADCFARFLAREEAQQERVLLERAQDLPFALCQTGHFSLARGLFLECGGFDETITRYGFEDIELAYRLSGRAVRLLYLPEAEALHRAYSTDLERYLARHLEVGIVARQLAERHPEGPFRDYLRVDGPEELGLGAAPLGLVALRVSNRLLLRPLVRRALGSRAGFALLRALLRLGETLRLERGAHMGYHVARDVRYFQGYFGELQPPAR